MNLYNIKYKNSMKSVDWRYYTRFYPSKTLALRALRYDTGLSYQDGKAVIEEIFNRIESGKVEKREACIEKKPEYNDEAKNISKKTGCVFFTIGYIILGVIFKLAGKYDLPKK